MQTKRTVSSKLSSKRLAKQAATKLVGGAGTGKGSQGRKRMIGRR